mgnify:CR=1 FL=1
MRVYPASETVCRELLEMPQQQIEWIITNATASELTAAGFQPRSEDQTCFIHPESGDVYRLARRQRLDKASGVLHYHCGEDVTLEDELAIRPLTILAMAKDGDEIIDPFDGREDLDQGVLRHVTPHFSRVPDNVLTVAVWSAMLKAWGFSIAHGTHALLKKMVAAGAVDRLEQQAIGDAVLKALASRRPSAFFLVLHRCGALRSISCELADLFELSAQAGAHHSDGSELPEAMQAIDRAASGTDNVASVLKQFHQALGSNAEKVFESLGLKLLYQNAHSQTS